ncbi:hypothetical protein BDY24DRAFT_76134 [Mrakia frigida]|uniref:uncharacterized protein n=1 Tax=Mrakia frigida TaxID=29902 RepID=UPI003FCBF931
MQQRHPRRIRGRVSSLILLPSLPHSPSLLPLLVCSSRRADSEVLVLSFCSYRLVRRPSVRSSSSSSCSFQAQTTSHLRRSLLRPYARCRFLLQPNRRGTTSRPCRPTSSSNLFVIVLFLRSYGFYHQLLPSFLLLASSSSSQPFSRTSTQQSSPPLHDHRVPSDLRSSLTRCTILRDRMTCWSTSGGGRRRRRGRRGLGGRRGRRLLRLRSKGEEEGVRARKGATIVRMRGRSRLQEGLEPILPRNPTPTHPQIPTQFSPPQSPHLSTQNPNLSSPLLLPLLHHRPSFPSTPTPSRRSSKQVDSLLLLSRQSLPNRLASEVPFLPCLERRRRSWTRTEWRR